MSMNETNKCPVCSMSVLEEYDICPICGWENDLIQLSKPDVKGANSMTLVEARKAYEKGERVI